MSPDVKHMIELSSLYYPTHIAPKMPPSQFNGTRQTSHPLKLGILPYRCCSAIFYDLDQAQGHFFDCHFKQVQKQYGQPPAEVDIGNQKFHVVHRAAAFLKCIKNLPSNPRHFRPAPLSKSPLEFKNPYSSAMALAYDFMETVIYNPAEYSHFIAKSSHHIPFSSHNNSWPYWAFFLYPDLLLKSPASVSLPSNNMMSLSSIMSSSVLDAKVTELKCPFLSCGKVCKVNSEFRTHLLKHHLQPRHFRSDLTQKQARATNHTFTCPQKRCTQVFPSQGDMRLHLLQSHFTNGTF
ncbi:hypothetical protein DSO57_1000471 [Entomophthora muscae]|uniref:Uncharacterized protein n=1 Tax=Entomophthora muscae TaxID=34485 RepID=A0ACC2UUN8_9FUNG|nr:hypothetical protein DSO57_1000471 [Entomophthora muscae]